MLQGTSAAAAASPRSFPAPSLRFSVKRSHSVREIYVFLSERQRPGTPDRERAFDCGLRVMLPVVMELKADQGLSSAGLFACSFLESESGRSFGVYK